MCHYRGASIKCVDVTKHHNWSPVLTVSGPIREPRPITGTVRLLRRWQLCYKSQVTCCWPLLSRWSVCGQPRVVLCISVYVVCPPVTTHSTLLKLQAATPRHTLHSAGPQTLQTQHQHRSRVLCSRCGSSTRKHRLTRQLDIRDVKYKAHSSARFATIPHSTGVSFCQYLQWDKL